MTKIELNELTRILADERTRIHRARVDTIGD